MTPWLLAGRGEFHVDLNAKATFTEHGSVGPPILNEQAAWFVIFLAVGVIPVDCIPFICRPVGINRFFWLIWLCSQLLSIRDDPRKREKH